VRNLFAVGCLTRPSVYFLEGNGKGISLYSLDESSGRVSLVHLTEGIDNPAFIAFSPRRQTLYCVSEVIGWNEGTVSAYRLDAEGALLHYVNKQPTLGSVTAHVSCDRDEGILAISNYSIEPPGQPRGKALALFRLRDDGGIEPAHDSREHAGKGVDPMRQERSHVHCGIASPSNRYMLFGEFGLDKIMAYPFDARTGLLGTDPISAPAVRPGAGPRHLAFHLNGEVVYASNELGGSVAAYEFRDESGLLTLLGEVRVVPERFDGPASTAEVAVHSSGRYAFASDRTCNSLAVLALDDDGRAMRLVAMSKTGGAGPRHFAVSPSGRWIVVGNQFENNLTVFSFDVASGGLLSTEQKVPTGSPMCVRFLPP
jgi:6-phosphogluconolactonase